MEVRRLGDLCKMQSGGTPRRSERSYYNGDIPWAKIGDIENAINGYITTTEEKITEAGLASINNRLFPKGALLFAMYGSVGKVAYAGVEMSTNQAILGIQPDDTVLETKYLSYWLKSKVRDFENQSRGVALKNVSATIMRDQEIPLPPLETQKKIAAILDKADELIRNDKKILGKYDELAQSVFLDMFGDPVTNPKGWEEMNLEDLCTHVIDCPHSTPKYVDYKTEFPCIRTTELRNGRIDWSRMKYLDYEGFLLRTKRLEPKEGDIVYGREGSFGEAAIIPPGIKMSLGQRVMLFRPNYEIVNSMYFHAMVRSPGVYNQAVRSTSGSTVGHVNIKDIRKFKCLLPPFELQERFRTAISQVDNQRQLTRQSLKRSEELFASLLQRAFKGELV